MLVPDTKCYFTEYGGVVHDTHGNEVRGDLDRLGLPMWQAIELVAYFVSTCKTSSECNERKTDTVEQDIGLRDDFLQELCEELFGVQYGVKCKFYEC